MAATPHKDKKKSNKWKQKALERRRQIRLLQSRVKQLEKSRSMWSSRYKELQGAGKGKKVKGHPYQLELMWLAAVLRIAYNVSLRACSKTLMLVGELKGLELKGLSASTIRNWSIRLGLYFLVGRIEKGRYVIIADEKKIVPIC